MFTIDIGPGEKAVLPAVIWVLHEVARDGSDSDVYAANAFGFYDEDLQGLHAQRARAAVARMRGNEELASITDRRADALQQLVKTPRQWLLARLFGLE